MTVISHSLHTNSDFFSDLKLTLNYAAEVVINLVVHFLFFIGNCVPINTLHDVIRLPAAAGHDVLIRNSDRMQNAGGVVPEIMQTEVRKTGMA